MLTHYLPDDILQYVVNQYMSHHPDDMTVIERCVRRGFRFNIDQYICCDRVYSGKVCTDYVLYVDGYCAVERRDTVSGYHTPKRYVRSYRKYGQLHGHIVVHQYAGTELVSAETGDYVHGAREGVHVRTTRHKIYNIVKYYRSVYNYVSNMLDGVSELYLIDYNYYPNYNSKSELLEFRHYRMHKGSPIRWSTPIY